MLIVFNYLLFQAARMCSKGTCYTVFQGPEEKITSFSLDFEDCFKDGCNICLSPGTCNLPQFPWLLGSVISFAKIFTPIRCTPSGIMSWYGTSCLKEFLTQTLPTVGRYPPWTLSLKTEPWKNLMKIEVNKALSISVISGTKSSTPFNNKIFPFVSIKVKLLLSLISPPSFISSWLLAFLTIFLMCSCF